MKTVLVTPTYTRPHDRYLEAVEASTPVLESAGIDHQIVFEVQCPYISSARATLLRKALDAKADIIVFLDHDLSWSPEALRDLIMTDGDVIAGTYRFKLEGEERYMGTLIDGADNRPVVREDGCIQAELVPAGFLKVTKEAVHRFMGAYPELIFGPRYNPSVDLFNHGAHNGLWWGEDYAFSRNWRAMRETLWLRPDLDITHWDGDKAYPGNFHEFLLRQPGGSNDPNRGADDAA